MSASSSKRNKGVGPPARRYASYQAAAEYVGVHQETIRRWIATGVIRGYAINKRLHRVDLNEIDAAMESGGQ